jgi:monoamine oxidase
MNTDHDVIVVGAGAAGLAATRTLLEAGLDVLCLEASGRIGGRVHTDHDIFGLPFDTGAHWLHNEAVNPFIALGQDMGFDLYPQHDRGYTHGDPDACLWRIKDALGDAMTAAAKSEADCSLLDLFTPTNEWSATAALMLTLSMGRDMAAISARDWALYHESPDWFCKQGFGTIVARNAGKLPVRIDTPVSAVARTAPGVRVETAQGAITARAVIVTVSQGVLAAEAIRFDPPLENDRLRAIGAITMGTYNHVALQFDPAAIPVEADTWVTYQVAPPDDAGVLRGGGFLCNVSGTGLSVFEHSGTFAREMETAGPATAIDFALTRLTEVFGTSIRQRFIKGHAMQWGQNPFTQGSYSGALPGGSDLRVHLRQPHAEVIHFAGEATHLSEMATVSGAYKEGLRAADAVIEQRATCK